MQSIKPQQANKYNLVISTDETTHVVLQLPRGIGKCLKVVVIDTGLRLQRYRAGNRVSATRSDNVGGTMNIGPGNGKTWVQRCRDRRWSPDKAKVVLGIDLGGANIAIKSTAVSRERERE